MISELKNNINNILKSNNILSTNRAMDILLIYLFYLKYLCEIGKYDYEKVIYNDKLYEIVPISKGLMERLNKIALLINGLLRNISFSKSQDLVIEFIKYYEDDFKYLNDDKKIVYILGRSMWPSSYNNFNVYDIKGNTTYTTEDEFVKNTYSYFKIFDEILGVHNEYLDINEINYDNYDNLYIYDNIPKYLRSNTIKNNIDIYRYIYLHLSNIKNIMLYSKYTKLSNFKEGALIVNYIKTIIIKDNSIIIIFNNDSNEISIINGNNPKITSLEELNRIITNNHKQKDLLVKTNYEEFQNNGMRIGFNLYQMKKKDTKIDINKIVDENTRYLEELNNINDIVERETNKLFNL